MTDIKFEEIEEYTYWVTNFDFNPWYNTEDFAEDYFSEKHKTIDIKLFLTRLKSKEINSIFRDNDLYKDIPLWTKCAFLNTIPNLYDWGTSENTTWISEKGEEYLKLN